MELFKQELESARLLVPEGYAVVPIEPTDAMVSEADMVTNFRGGCRYTIAWKAMIKVAQESE